MAEFIPEEEIARRAYEAWRTEASEPRLPQWELASQVTHGAWIARVSMYHERPWTATEERGVMDRFVREAATKAGR